MIMANTPPENSNAIKNDNINIEEDKIIVKVSDVLKKLKSPCDCRNFALENSKFIIIIFINIRLVYT